MRQVKQTARFFDPLTIRTKITWYVSSEFGIGMLTVAIVLAVYFSIRRAEVEVLPALAVHKKQSDFTVQSEN